MVLELCGIGEVVAAASPSAHAIALLKQCDRLKAKIMKRQRVAHVPKEKTRKARKTAKDTAYRITTAALHALARERCGGNCEECGQPERPFDPLHMHHELGGSGRRRQKQALANVKMIHLSCHEREHGVRR